MSSLQMFHRQIRDLLRQNGISPNRSHSILHAFIAQLTTPHDPLSSNPYGTYEYDTIEYDSYRIDTDISAG